MNSQEEEANDLTGLHDEALEASVGLGLVKGLDSIAADKVQNASVKTLNKMHLDLAAERAKRLGLPDNWKPPMNGEDMQSVRIRSPDQHYHYPPPQPNSNVPGWVKGAALLGLSGLAGAVGYQLLKPTKPPQVVETPQRPDATLNPGGLTIEVVPGVRPNLPQ